MRLEGLVEPEKVFAPETEDIEEQQIRAINSRLFDQKVVHLWNILRSLDFSYIHTLSGAEIYARKVLTEDMPASEKYRASKRMEKVHGIFQNFHLEFRESVPGDYMLSPLDGPSLELLREIKTRYCPERHFTWIGERVEGIYGYNGNGGSETA